MKYHLKVPLPPKILGQKAKSNHWSDFNESPKTFLDLQLDIC